MTPPLRMSVFDRFAARATELVSGALFFILCALLVLIWLPSYYAFRNINTWQLRLHGDIDDLRASVGIESTSVT